MDALSRRMYRRSIVAAVLLLIVASLFLAWTLRKGYQLHQEGATDDLLNHTLNLERQLEARLQSCDLILQAATQDFRRTPPNDEQQREAFSAQLRQLAGLLPGTPQVRGANRAGQVIYGQGLDPSQPLSVAQRRFFIEAAATPSLVIGLPLKSRVSHTWVVPLARQLQDSHGAFAGVVYANVELEEVSSSLRGLLLGSDGVASIFNLKGEVLVRSLDEPDRTDEGPMRVTAPATRDAIAKGLEAHAYEVTSLVDGISRLTMFRKIGPYPLYVGVGLGWQEVLQGWYAEVRAAVTVWLILGLGAVYFTFKQRQASRLQSDTLHELDEARLRADRANAYKSVWLANMSHELRTPMNGVLGFAQLGQRLAVGSPEVIKAFTRIVDAGRLLQAILNDVLDMSKIEADKLLLHPEPTVLRNVAIRAADLVGEAASAKGIAVHWWAADDVPVLVTLDGLRLQQILLNLLSNAVKFTDAGRVELTMEIANSQLVCSVKDSGNGLTAEQIGRLFRPFEQGDASITRRHGGTGLGLAITKRLVQLMGGTVEATSEMRVGSTFTVRLPFTQASSSEPTTSLPQRDGAIERIGGEPESTPLRPRLQGLRVLVVEDNEVNQLVIHGMLVLEGASVDIVSNGYDAIDLVVQPDARFDLVLLDVMMPGIDGYETARRMHRQVPDLPIIGQTAHAMPEEMAMCRDAGMLDRIVKPIVLEDLVQTIRRHVPAKVQAS